MIRKLFFAEMLSCSYVEIYFTNTLGSRGVFISTLSAGINMLFHKEDTKAVAKAFIPRLGMDDQQQGSATWTERCISRGSWRTLIHPWAQGGNTFLPQHSYELNQAKHFQNSLPMISPPHW